MEEGFRSINTCKEGRVELDLNVEPMEETENTFVKTDTVSHQKYDFQPLEIKLEGRGSLVNVKSENGACLAASATACVEESKCIRCDGDVVRECNLDGNRYLPIMSNGSGRVKEEPYTSQQVYVRKEKLKSHDDFYESGQVEKRVTGRKRKNAENYQGYNEEAKRKKDNHESSKDKTGNLGMGLRSKMNHKSPAETQLMEAIEEDHKLDIDQPQEAIKGSKKVKGRRGRPPKIRDNDKIAPRISKDKKKVNERLGRPPKTPSQEGSSEMVTVRKDLEHESKEKHSYNNQDGNTIKSSNMSIKLKEVDGGRRAQRQVVRDQIVDILIKSGWTIEYRPRQAREYRDAVYVDGSGRTHWSITFAYKRLKDKVDAGAADAKTLSAFTVIPEEVLEILSRKTRGKKEKSVKNGKGSKSVKNPKSKEKLNNKPKFRDRSLKKTVKTNVHSPDHHTSKKGSARSKRDGRSRKSYALLARRSEEMSADQEGEGFVVYDGKRNLLSWMIDSGAIKSGSVVQYMNGEREEVMREGKINSDGICCCCCGQTFALFDFETHAGSTLCQPLKHICIESGCSLLQCLAESWRGKQEEYERMKFHGDVDADDDPNDDTCNICGDGGDLICCDGCPSTFHQNCLNIQKLPSGDWRCVYCSCKFCGTVAGDVDGHTTASDLPLCHLCEERFHFSCKQDETADNLDSMGLTLTFCGQECEKLYEGLQALLGVKHDMDEGFSWTVLHQSSVGKEDEIGRDNNMFKIECNSRLAVAFSVMDECFMPILDQRSKMNVIQNVVYNIGSNFKRLNFCGFYTVILEKGDDLVAAASIRLHGNVLAEMPFIGTRYKYRRQGMCRRLLCSIETALSSLGIKKLVIPAITELNETWTKVFGFMPLEESKRREMMHMSLIVFPGTDMLQKPVLKKHQGTEESHIMSPDAIAELNPKQKLDAIEALESHSTSLTSSHGSFLEDTPSDMKSGFESFVRQEGLKVQ
ncbi:unnamed protein product [Cuscuta epithymum]|uniref:PHD-type domain-containing protein n=1 Tax=Cuscuta epithymum TaxID=186058 RepID=A0AAV0FB97_9ASTE|nr:unnamed protein product [Cuscuta epithymum]